MYGEINICELCERSKQHITKHHQIPKSINRISNRIKRNGKIYIIYKGKEYLETVSLCGLCHKQIHALFTEKELANKYNTIVKLKANAQVKRFIEWVRKKDPKHIKIRQSKHWQ